MIDTRKILEGVLSQAGLAGPSGNPAEDSQSKTGKMNLGGFGGGAAVGGLAGLLLGTKSGRKMGKSAIKLGGLALIAALAYRAWQNWKSGSGTDVTTGRPDEQKALPSPENTAFLPTNSNEQQRIARNMLRAMIAAAKADGHIDAEELDRIHGKMDELDLGSEDKAFVMDELRAPVDVAAIARSAHTREEATEIYVASLLTIDGGKPGEQKHLQRLSGLLGLDSLLVAELEGSVRDVVVLTR